MHEPIEATIPPVIPEPRVRLREIAALIGLVVVADLTVFRGQGYAGLAVLFAGVPLLVALGRPRLRPIADLLIVSLLLAGVVLRLVWCGNVLSVLCGILLSGAVMMTLSGQRPFALELLASLAQVIPSAVLGLAKYRDDTLSLPAPAAGLTRARALGVVLPLIAFLLFGLLFTLANPNLMTWFGDEFAEFFQALREWFACFSVTEPVFWAVCAFLAIGLLRPLAAVAPAQSARSEQTVSTSTGPLADGLYAGFRNTLLVVTVLFAVYLAFEGRTLWTGELPAGFDYAGYAHQGAFWLTVALGLATIMLCLIFRGAALSDPRLPTLRTLGAIWAVENLLLAVAVYHRLWLYVDFNGMTRLRTAGFLGTTAVVAGLFLVLWKILRNRNSTWLIRRQLWVLALVVYVDAVVPVDRWVTQYNVARLLNGKAAPFIYRGDFENSTEGRLMLAPLLESNDVAIRDFTRAQLVAEATRLAATNPSRSRHWTAWQWADEVLRKQLTELGLEAPPAADQP